MSELKPCPFCGSISNNEATAYFSDINKAVSDIHSDIDPPLKLNAQDLTEEQRKILSEAPGSDLENGKLVWATPYARYLYYGVLMVDSKTGSPHARKGDKKVLTSKELEYSKKFAESTPCKLWCEKAREKYGDDWKLIYEKALREEMSK